jgi:hypothetical protein
MPTAVLALQCFLSFLPGLEGQLVLLELVAPVGVDLLVVCRLVGGATSAQQRKIVRNYLKHSPIFD